MAEPTETTGQTQGELLRAYMKQAEPTEAERAERSEGARNADRIFMDELAARIQALGHPEVDEDRVKAWVKGEVPVMYDGQQELAIRPVKEALGLNGDQTFELNAARRSLAALLSIGPEADAQIAAESVLVEINPAELQPAGPTINVPTEPGMNPGQLLKAAMRAITPTPKEREARIAALDSHVGLTNSEAAERSRLAVATVAGWVNNTRAIPQEEFNEPGSDVRKLQAGLGLDDGFMATLKQASAELEERIAQRRAKAESEQRAEQLKQELAGAKRRIGETLGALIRATPPTDEEKAARPESLPERLRNSDKLSKIELAARIARGTAKDGIPSVTEEDLEAALTFRGVVQASQARDILAAVQGEGNQAEATAFANAVKSYVDIARRTIGRGGHAGRVAARQQAGSSTELGG